MGDRLQRKIEETAALQIKRRGVGDSVFDRMGLSTHGTRDAFVEAQMVEQPVDQFAGAAGGDKDVIVPPDMPPDAGGAMAPGEEPIAPEEEEPEDEEEETDVDEEMKRSLFNTLSELIDLGRIGRNEQEIRQYVDDHEDEIGELMDVLDDVIDMLIGEGDVMREPKTFDIGDEEQPPTDQNSFDELKPGVGGQVPRGGTTTTIIASDQTPTTKRALRESIVTGIVSDAEIDATLERAAELTEDEDQVILSFPDEAETKKALDTFTGMSGIATSNVMKTSEREITVTRTPQAAADVEKQLKALRDAGVKFETNEPAAAEGAATDARLVSGPNVGQHSTVQSEAIFSRWYVGKLGNSGRPSVNPVSDKASAKDDVDITNSNNPRAKAMLFRASDAKSAMKKYARRVGVAVPLVTDEPEEDPVASAAKSAAAAAQAASSIAGKTWDVFKPLGWGEKPQGTPQADPQAVATRGAETLEPGNVVKSKVAAGINKDTALKILTGAVAEDPQKGYTKDAAKQALKNAGVSDDAIAKFEQQYGGTGRTEGLAPEEWRVSYVDPETGRTETVNVDSIMKAETLEKNLKHLGYQQVRITRDRPRDFTVAAESEVDEGYQRWSDPTMRVRQAMGEAEVTWVDDEGKRQSIVFESAGEARSHARDLKDLGYRRVSVNEELNVARTGMAVEVVFSDKQQAATSKGALLQYKGIDTVKEAGNGTLVVFTTDTDAEEARNRVTTILNNARVPMEGFNCTRYKEVILEANPGGQSASGRAVPPIGNRQPGPNFMDVPMPTGGGGKGASEEEEVDEQMIGPDFGRCSRCGKQINAKDMKARKCGSCWKEIPDADERRKKAGVAEQTGPEDPEDKEKYMRPFYAPDDEGDIGQPDEPIPEPGEPGYDEMLGAGEIPGDEDELEPEGEGDIWRMDIPEDPAEKERLTTALNSAKEAGIVASWTEITGDEEDLDTATADLGDDMLAPDEAGMDDDVPQIKPEFLEPKNEPRPTSPPGIGEAVGDDEEFRDDELVAPEEEPGVEVDLDAVGPVDELPPEEEPAGDEPYIAVEFSPETEPDERESFPDWIADETADPETGEGGVTVAGWTQDSGADEIGDEIPDENLGEFPEVSPEDSEELSPEFSEGMVPTIDQPEDEVPVPEERILGEDVQHLRNIYRASRLAEGKGDELMERRFTAALVEHGHARGITRQRMAGLLRVDEDALAEVYGDPEEERVARHQIKHHGKMGKKPKIPWKQPAQEKPEDLFGDEPSADIPWDQPKAELPADLAKLHDDYLAAKSTGDASAPRIWNELKFQAGVQGIDLDAMGITEAFKPGRKMFGRLAGRIYELAKRGARARSSGDAEKAERLEDHVETLMSQAQVRNLGDEAEEAKQMGLDDGSLSEAEGNGDKYDSETDTDVCSWCGNKTGKRGKRIAPGNPHFACPECMKTHLRGMKDKR